MQLNRHRTDGRDAVDIFPVDANDSRVVRIDFKALLFHFHDRTGYTVALLHHDDVRIRHVDEDDRAVLGAAS